MKRILAATTAFVILICAGVVGGLYFDRTCHELSDALDESIRLTNEENYSAARTLLSNAEELWNKGQPILCLYQNHSYLYEVSSKMEGLYYLCNEEAKEEFLAGAIQAKAALDYVRSDK